MARSFIILYDQKKFAVKLIELKCKQNVVETMSKKTKTPLKTRYDAESGLFEVGIDEAGRGPMYGPVYAAAVVLPPEGEFKHSDMKDSKKFHSEKKIKAVAEYIKENAIAWGVGVSTAADIDTLNIRRATHRAMHNAIKIVQEKLGDDSETFLLVDGNDFTPHLRLVGNIMVPDQFRCIEGGDDKYTAIAAASILAKVERDAYIVRKCEEDPQLQEKYGILKNKGYGTAVHMEGIRTHGITDEHRKTFGICREFASKS